MTRNPADPSVGHYAARSFPRVRPVSGDQLVVRQTQASTTDLPPQDAILFDEIGHRLSLSAIEPASDGVEQQLKDRHVDNERERIPRTPQEWPQSCRSWAGTLRGAAVVRER